MEMAQGRQRQGQPPQGDNYETEAGRACGQPLLQSGGKEQKDDGHEGDDAADIAVGVAAGRDEVAPLDELRSRLGLTGYIDPEG